MRRFYLKNEIGERKNLQTRGELFFSSPTGMGFANTNAYAQTGGFFTRTSAEQVQGAIAGELVFGGYTEYRALADWIFSGYELQIVYAPENDEYIADIDIVSISKGELSRGVLVCPVSISMKTPWYRANAVRIALAPPESDIGWATLPFALPVQLAASGVSSAVSLSPAGHMPAAIRVEVPGELTNPCLTLKDANESVIGKMDLPNVSIPSGGKLIFSTRHGETGVRNGQTDLLGSIDLSNNNFFSVPQGKTSTLILSAANTISALAVVTLYEYFRTV